MAAKDVLEIVILESNCTLIYFEVVTILVGQIVGTFNVGINVVLSVAEVKRCQLSEGYYFCNISQCTIVVDERAVSVNGLVVGVCLLGISDVLACFSQVTTILVKVLDGEWSRTLR